MNAINFETLYPQCLTFHNKTIMGKKGLSIRYKILLLLTLLPLATLLFYLFFVAIRVFEEDKIAYVFETNSSLSRTLSSQVQSELSGVINAAKPIFQDYASTNTFGVVSKSTLDVHKNILWIAAYKLTKEKNSSVTNANNAMNANKSALMMQFISSSSDNVLESQAKSYESANSLLEELEKNSTLIRVPYKDHRILIGEKVKDDLVFFVLADLSNLVKSFQEPMAASVYLVNASSYVFLGPGESQGSYLSEEIDLNGKEAPWSKVASQNQFTSGTAQMLNHTGQQVLVSYSTVPVGGLTIVALVERAMALRSVDVLIRKSIYFFGLLIAVTTIVSLLASRRLTQSLSQLFQATRKVAEGHFNIHVPVESNDEVGSLADSFNVMASEVSRLLAETAEKARMESELKTAQTVQETLFPPTEADISGLKISGYYEPASECGGDWWHYGEVNGKIMLWIGDATGHGAAAALITSAAKSAASIIESLGASPAEALNHLNRAIYDVSKGRLMMTFFVASLDPSTGQLTYANASHEAPFLFHKKNGELKKKDLIPLNDINNPRVGQSRDTVYQQVQINLNPGDRILFYTDGIPDIHDPSGKAWGERAFIKSLLDVNKDNTSTSVAVKQMVSLFSKHRQGQNLIDDITFFQVQYLE